MGQRVQTVEETHPQNHPGKPGDHSTTRRRPAGCKPGPAPDSESFGRQLEAVVRLCFPELNRWLDALPEPRRLDMCVYAGRHLWWQIILTHLLRGGSRNAFDAERNGVRLLATPSTCVQFATGSDEFRVSDELPGYRWLRLHADGRLETGIERLAALDWTPDMNDSY